MKNNSQLRSVQDSRLNQPGASMGTVSTQDVSLLTEPSKLTKVGASLHPLSLGSAEEALGLVEESHEVDDQTAWVLAARAECQSQLGDALQANVLWASALGCAKNDLEFAEIALRALNTSAAETVIRATRISGKSWSDSTEAHYVECLAKDLIATRYVKCPKWLMPFRSIPTSSLMGLAATSLREGFLHTSCLLFEKAAESGESAAERELALAQIILGFPSSESGILALYETTWDQGTEASAVISARLQLSQNLAERLLLTQVLSRPGTWQTERGYKASSREDEIMSGALMVSKGQILNRDVEVLRLRQSLSSALMTSIRQSCEVLELSRRDVFAGLPESEDGRSDNSEWPTSSKALYERVSTSKGCLATSAHEISWPQGKGSTLYLLHNSLPYHSAGYATRTHGLLAALNGQGWKALGVTRPGYPGDMTEFEGSLGDSLLPAEVIDGVTYLRLPSGGIKASPQLGSYLADYSVQVANVAEKRDAVLIHGASNSWNGWAAVQAAQKLGIPSVYEVRGLWMLTRGSRDPAYALSTHFRSTLAMELEAIEAASLALCITQPLREFLESSGAPKGKLRLLKNGVDTERFIPKPRDAKLEIELGLKGKIVIGYIGSLLDYEGLDVLLQAAHGLKDLANRLHFLVVGGGAAFEETASLVETLQLNDFVTLTGKVSHEEVEAYYSLIDIAPFPRHSLPVTELVSPLKPFEALASGKVIVLSDCQVLQDIVGEGAPGRLFPAGDSDSLRMVLRELVDDDKSRRAMGEQGRAWVVTNRSWNSLAAELALMYGGG